MSGLSDTRQSLTRALADDYVVSYATAVRQAARPQINMRALDAMTKTASKARCSFLKKRTKKLLQIIPRIILRGPFDHEQNVSKSFLVPFFKKGLLAFP